MNVKKWLPKETYHWHSPHSPEALHQRMSGIVQPKSTGILWKQPSPGSKPYEGVVQEAGFEVQRLISHRNSFLPQISGRIYRRPTGSHIWLEFRLHTFVMVFIVFWLSMAGLAAVGAIVYLSFQLYRGTLSSGDANALIPIGMFLFGCVLTVGAFKSESSGSVAYFQKLFEATDTPQTLP